MGSSSSKEDDPTKRLAPPKPGQIDVSDRSKLVKLELRPLNIPKPPGIATTLDKGVLAECEGTGKDNLVAFDISKDYDMNKFFDRYKSQYNSVNPALYLNSNKTIKAAQDTIS